jgi:hypothetical protein
MHSIPGVQVRHGIKEQANFPLSTVSFSMVSVTQFQPQAKSIKLQIAERKCMSLK